VLLSAVAEDDTDRPTSAKPLDVVAGEYSSGQAKPQTPTVPAKRTLKNVKTMFYVGTEVRLLVLHFIITTS